MLFRRTLIVFVCFLPIALAWTWKGILDKRSPGIIAEPTTDLDADATATFDTVVPTTVDDFDADATANFADRVPMTTDDLDADATANFPDDFDVGESTDHDFITGGLNATEKLRDNENGSWTYGGCPNATGAKMLTINASGSTPTRIGQWTLLRWGFLGRDWLCDLRGRPMFPNRNEIDMLK